MEIIGLYSTGKILKAERYILKSIDYKVSWSGPTIFLYRINKVNGQEK